MCLGLNQQTTSFYWIILSVTLTQAVIVAINSQNTVSIFYRIIRRNCQKKIIKESNETSQELHQVCYVVTTKVFIKLNIWITKYQKFKKVIIYQKLFI